MIKINNFKKIKKLIIAEIGNNHEGSLKNAFKLVNHAILGGADAIKFQVFSTEKFQSYSDKKRFKKLKRFELGNTAFVNLFNYVKKKRKILIATPLDVDSVKFLSKYVDVFKISSGDNNFWNMINCIVSYKKPIIISTGMSNLKDIYKIRNFLKDKINKDKVCFLHCVSSYPTENKDANLLAIRFLKNKLDYEIGYSDHTIGIFACKVAFSLGARVIEKHFTLSHNFSKFRDHKISATKDQLQDLNKFILKFIEISGLENKIITFNEKLNINNSRRSPYANKDLKTGHFIKSKDIIFLRPKKYFSTENYLKILGKKIIKDIKKGDSFNNQNTGFKIR
jgi:sialic acid synthase SpsE